MNAAAPQQDCKFEIGERVYNLTLGPGVVKATTPVGINIRFDLPNSEGEIEDTLSPEDLMNQTEYSAWSASHDEAVIAQLKMLFEPGDFVCLTGIHSTKTTDAGSAETVNIVRKLEDVTGAAVVWMRSQNSEGSNRYVAMNPLLPGTDRRVKENFAAARSVFMECDFAGEEVLAQVHEAAAAGNIPLPTIVLCSSPGKYQFAWRVNADDFDASKVETVNGALVNFFSGDPACTDRLRVFRLTSFANFKYPERPACAIVETNDIGRRYDYADFQIPMEDAKATTIKPAASESEVAATINYFDQAAEEAKLNVKSFKKWGSQGFIYEITCPFLNSHTGRKDSGTVVMIHPSAAISFKCAHGHCAERTWQDVRPEMEKIAGHSLRFGDPVGGVTVGGHGMSNGVVEPSKGGTPVTATFSSVNIHLPYSDDIFYGLAGRIIRKLQPETESHPVGNLIELLTAYGNIIGPNPFYVIEDKRHYTNLFVVKVGKSSKSRKGTGKARIERIVSGLDLCWFTSRNTSGMGSGESVVWEVRDKITGPVKDKHSGAIRFEVVDPGIDDKRLYISEGEFVGVLAVAGRKDSLLSKVIRDAWDHNPIRNKTKGQAVVCQDPHISISADITREELQIQLKESDKFNGFSNRFLWCFVERQGLKPHGGEEIDWSAETAELYKAVQFGRSQKRIFMDRNARRIWERMYGELSEDIPGLVGAVTSRGEAQTIRLALIFAMLDLSDHIGTEHLKAARALWQYLEDSARIIFGGVTKDHQRILDFLSQGPKSISDFITALFAKNRTKEKIQTDLATLMAVGRVVSITNESGVETFRLAA